MRYFKKHIKFIGLISALGVMVILCGCDSGEKVVDEVTGNRAVKEYHKAKKNVEEIGERQAEKYGSIPDENDTKSDE